MAAHGRLLPIAPVLIEVFEWQLSMKIDLRTRQIRTLSVRTGLNYYG
jgi:hypothetical protein